MQEEKKMKNGVRTDQVNGGRRLMYDAPPPPNKIKNMPPMPWWFPYTEFFMLGLCVLIWIVLVVVLSVYHMKGGPKKSIGRDRQARIVCTSWEETFE